ncbi:glycosyltransferase family 4 protein [Megasphaera elsdenii]|uniref:glycosyltransferase family 4 protein n=1 Tax=Megasphaera elsdenii TaxID=907 RepID=UPI004035EBEF
MRRIAYVINFIVKGGPSAVVLNMIHNLDRTRFEPVLITLFEGNSPEIVAREKEAGLKIVECGHKSRFQFLLHGLSEYRRILEDNHIDIVHGHGFIPDVMNARLGKPFKTISTAHNIMFEDYLLNYGKIKSLVYCRIHLWAMRQLDQVICCSKSVYDVMKNYIPGCQYIENGIEDFSYSCQVSRSDLHIPEDAIVFLYAGYLIRRKRVPFLVKNFVKCHGPKEYLLILGTGEDENLCRTLADNHVIFAGFQPNPYQYMAISNIYTSASSSEGFSISVLEALHCGLGLFLSDIPSHREVIEQTSGVYLGEYFSKDNFADQYNGLIRNMSNINSDSIRAYQKNKLSAISMVRQYENIYNDVKQVAQ